MIIEKCSNCGHHMTFAEAVGILGQKKGSPYESLGINSFLNTTNVKCPVCGLMGSWISEDEEEILSIAGSNSDR